MGKRKIILFLLLLFFSLSGAVAQQKTITGKVVDKNGQPILAYENDACYPGKVVKKNIVRIQGVVRHILKHC